jgi:hypothetical protein
MRTAIATAMLLATATVALAQYNPYGTYGTYGNSGQYGTGSNLNNTQLDNYGTRGNYNPYTGSYGTRVARY